MQLFKRSTRAIVTGRRPKTPAPDAGDGTPVSPPGEQVEGLAEGDASPSGNLHLEGINMKFQSIPKWAVGAACGVLFLLIAAVLLLNRTPGTPQTPDIAAGQSIIAVSADSALTAQAVPGDVVRLYDENGESIEALQYVQVYDTAGDNQLLLLVDDNQAAVMVRQTISEKVVLVVHDDSKRAAGLLELQARINDPEITLTLQAAATLAPGETLEPTVHTAIDPVEAILPQVQWTTSDAAVATVENGVITAQGVGQAMICAACGDQEATCTVTVEVPLSAIALSQTETVVAVGETTALTAAADPENATHFSVTWSTVDPAIAIVAEDGTITGVAAGTTTITASSGDITASCTVTVGVHAEIVQLDKTSLELTVGQTAVLTGTIYPGSGVIDTAQFVSSDPAIATVSADGTVTAVAPGTVTVTYRCGGAEAVCTVVIKEP